MHKLILILTLLAVTLAPALRAQSVPARHEVAIAWGADTNAWPVPALENGHLWTLQVGGVTNGATLAVKHLVPYGSGAYFTNTVEAAAAAGTLYAYGPVPVYTGTVQIAKQTLLVPGDLLLFDLSATNTAASILLTTGVR